MSVETLRISGIACGASLGRLACAVLVASATVLVCGARAEPATDATSESPSSGIRQPLLTFLPSPAHKAAQLPRVVAGADGGVYASWVEEAQSADGAVAEVWVARWRDEQWRDRERVAAGNNWFVNWADFPTFTDAKQGQVVTWLQKRAEGTYDYDLYASSRASPRNAWSGAMPIHRDGVAAEHGFVSVVPINSPLSTAPEAVRPNSAEASSGDGGFLMAWLDGRNTIAPDPLLPNKRGPMSLRATYIDSAGQSLTQWQVDDRVCDCCQTTMIATDDGVLLAYRDRSTDDVRDIVVRRLEGAQWSEPKAISDEQWQIEGCPVNGPALAAHSSQVAIAWFNAAHQQPKVRLKLSHNGGAVFTDVIEVSDGFRWTDQALTSHLDVATTAARLPATDAGATLSTLGRVDVVVLSNGHTVVSWLAFSAQRAFLVLSRFDAEGARIDDLAIAEIDPSRRSGFPIMAAIGDSVCVTWTHTGEQPSIRVATVDY